MLALYALQSLASFYRNYWAGLAGNRLIFDLQCRLFSHLQSLPHSFFDQNPSGAIVSRVLNDVQQANELVGSALIDVWMDGISLTLVVAALLALNWRLALVALCISPLWVAFMRFFSPRIKSVSHRMQETVEEIAGEVHERVAGASTIKSFCREDYEVEQFRGQTERLFERTIDKVRLAARQEMLIQLLTRAAPTVVIWVGAAHDHPRHHDARHDGRVFLVSRFSLSAAGTIRATVGRGFRVDGGDRAYLRVSRSET